MLELYAEFAEQKKGYSTDDFKRIASKYAGEDLTDFFADFYFGTAPFESLLVETFENLGFTLEMKANPNLTESLLGL